MINVVLATVAQQNTARLFKLANQIVAFHTTSNSLTLLMPGRF